jgi:hypothetical protein
MSGEIEIHGGEVEMIVEQDTESASGEDTTMDDILRKIAEEVARTHGRESMDSFRKSILFMLWGLVSLYIVMDSIRQVNDIERRLEESQEFAAKIHADRFQKEETLGKLLHELTPEEYRDILERVNNTNPEFGDIMEKVHRRHELNYSH